METHGLHLAASATLKEKRLRSLLGGRPEPAALLEIVADAQLLGSLELAGFSFRWDEVRAERQGRPSPSPIGALRRAQAMAGEGAALSVELLLAWHGAIVGNHVGFRREARLRAPGPPPAPPAFIESRVRLLEEWLGMASGRELKPIPAAALALARIMEILPFETANGRLARLAASNLMRHGGLRPPILVRGDAARLEAALQAAFQLETGPLGLLLEQAAERALDVMIRTLEAGAGGP